MPRVCQALLNTILQEIQSINTRLHNIEETIIDFKETIDNFKKTIHACIYIFHSQ